MYKLTRLEDRFAPLQVSVVGIGGAGCNVLKRISSGPDGPALVALNTDLASLDRCPASTKLQIGAAQTKGMGCGGDDSVGRLAATNDAEMISALFADSNLAIFVVGLGGGTGTGAAPLVVTAARECGALTVVLATTPFAFEGEQRRALAEEGLAALSEAADIVVRVSNDDLFDQTERPQVSDAFSRADVALSAGVCGVWRMLTHAGLIGIDPADLQRVAYSEPARFGFGTGAGSDRAATALKAIVEGAMFNHGATLAEANQLLVVVSGSPDLTVEETRLIMDGITGKAHEGARITVGIIVAPDEEDDVTVFAFAGTAALDQPPVNITSSSPPRKTKKRKARDQQDRLKFGADGKGRFRNVEATIMDGEDFDVPTYVRRGIRIDR